jgi:FAD/FMN-containing dehydrogenase
MARFGGMVVAANNREQPVNSNNIVNFLQAVSAADTAALKARLACEVILPGEANYDEARRTPNLNNDRKPAVVVRPESTGDVAEAIKFARQHSLPIAVKSGGHSIPGLSVLDDGLLIDMHRFKNITIDPETRTARVQPAATSGDLAGPAHAYGLALTTGDAASVGLGGLTLGGGIGFMARKYGLTIDNLLSVELVTAEGEVVRASKEQNTELFWALRGGGGNFGVVTEFEYQLAPVGQVYGGALIIPATVENVRKYVDYATTAPDDLTTITNVMHAPPAPFIPEDRVGELVLMILVVYTGEMEDGERVMQPLRDIATPVADLVGPMPYPVIYNFTEPATHPHFSHIRSMFSHGISDEAIERMLEVMQRATSPMAMAQLRPLGGAFNRVPVEETAFAHRDKDFFFAALGLWMDPEDDKANRAAHVAWTEELWSAVKSERDGVYVNFLGNESRARIAEAYPTDTYARLAQVKATYDPENIFSGNQNIRPLAPAVERAAA